ncbi:MAG: hypothetical protein GF309_10260, partial [Candidatus Lokiarchaeota archaeon]|nr:hypothetical protein [Candidatus Lokiarchaeota archaeon]
MRFIAIRAELTIGFSSPQPFEFPVFAEEAVQNGYNPPTEGGTLMAVDNKGLQMKLERISKNGLQIIYNADRGHLSLSSEETQLLVANVNDVLGILNEAIGEAPSIKWYEFNYHVKIRSKIIPLESEVTDESLPARIFGEKTGMKVRPYSKAWCAFEGEVPTIPLNKVPEWLNVSVAPYVQNPRYFYANVVYRRISIDE